MKTYEEAMALVAAEEMMARSPGLTAAHLDMSTMAVNVYFDKATQIGDYAWSGDDSYHSSASCELLQNYEEPNWGYYRNLHYAGESLYLDKDMGSELDLTNLLQRLFEAGQRSTQQ